jgi:hypothetical protein
MHRRCRGELNIHIVKFLGPRVSTFTRKHPPDQRELGVCTPHDFREAPSMCAFGQIAVRWIERRSHLCTALLLGPMDGKIRSMISVHLRDESTIFYALGLTWG